MAPPACLMGPTEGAAAHPGGPIEFRHRLSVSFLAPAQQILLETTIASLHALEDMMSKGRRKDVTSAAAQIVEGCVIMLCLALPLALGLVKLKAWRNSRCGGAHDGHSPRDGSAMHTFFQHQQFVLLFCSPLMLSPAFFGLSSTQATDVSRECFFSSETLFGYICAVLIGNYYYWGEHQDGKHIHNRGGIRNQFDRVVVVLNILVCAWTLDWGNLSLRGATIQTHDAWLRPVLALMCPSALTLYKVGSSKYDKNSTHDAGKRDTGICCHVMYRCLGNMGLCAPLYVNSLLATSDEHRYLLRWFFWSVFPLLQLVGTVICHKCYHISGPIEHVDMWGHTILQHDTPFSFRNVLQAPNNVRSRPSVRLDKRAELALQKVAQSFGVVDDGVEHGHPDQTRFTVQKDLEQLTQHVHDGASTGILLLTEEKSSVPGLSVEEEKEEEGSEDEEEEMDLPTLCRDASDWSQSLTPRMAAREAKDSQ